MDDPGMTRYQVIVGPGTPFERDGLTFDDFPDGISETVLVIDAGEAVPWSKPADLTYDPNGPLPRFSAEFSKPRLIVCYEIGRDPAFHACFADGSLRFIRSTADETTIRAIITRNGGEKVDLSMLD
jgi:hypothetical protein